MKPTPLILFLTLARAGLSLVLTPALLWAPPPYVPGPDLPGTSKGKLETYWVAPYVRASVIFGRTTVTWFGQDRSIQRQTDAIAVQSGFIDATHQNNAGEVVWGTNEDWKIALPVRSGESGYATATPDSRVFIEEFHPKPGLISLNIYVHGKLTNTAGPFLQYKADEVHLSDDGSASLIVWKYESKKTAQIIGLDANGTVRFRVDCENPISNEGVAPDGAGVLLSPNSGRVQNTFLWYTSEGRRQSLQITPNPYLVGWIPKTHHSLFTASAGYRILNYRLIDWDSGGEIWETAPPGTGQVLAIGITPQFLLFEEAELYVSGPWRGPGWLLSNGRREWVRTFYAVRVQDGSIAARWQAKDPQRLTGEGRDRFLWMNDRLFYMTAGEFTELNLNDIVSKTNGWAIGSTPGRR